MSYPPCDDGAVNDSQTTSKQTKYIIMKSYEVLRQVFKPVGCKNVAAELGLSLSLIHQWSRAQDGQSEKLNPLDRVVQLAALPDGEELLEWLCRQAGGSFVRRAQLPAQVRRWLDQITAEWKGLLKPESRNNQAGGSRCKHRLAGGRCGFPHATRN